MKKINLLAVIGIVFLVFIVAGFMIWVSKDGKKTEENQVFLLDNKSDVEAYVDANSLQRYSFDIDECYLGDLQVLGHDAEVECYFDESNNISQLVVHYLLFQYTSSDETGTEDEESEDTSIYDFTDEDKKKIDESFQSIKKLLEKYLDCKLETYDVVPTYQEANTEDSDENFYQGNVIREYSIRDRAGILWLLRYEASYGSATATLEKVIDDSEYAGFIPAIDMFGKTDGNSYVQEAAE